MSVVCGSMVPEALRNLTHNSIQVIIRLSVDGLCKDGLSESHMIHVQNVFRTQLKTVRMALETHENTPEVHMYLCIGPKGPYIPT